MDKSLLLGIDIGTSGCKMTIFNLQGEVISSASIGYRTYYPSSGYAEQDANDWWMVVCQGIQKMVTENRIDASQIAGIGVDGHSWACLPVDALGAPLRRAMIWLDRRSVSQADWLKSNIGEDKLIALNGNPVDPAYIVPKMLWIKENEPEVYKIAYKYLQSNSFIVFKLTGEFSQDYSQGYGFSFFDISKGVFDGDMAGKMGISPDLAAPLYNCSQIVGTLSASAAYETGLVPGIPVAAGGLDAACCTLGAGVVRPGQTQEQGGQAGGMSIQIDKPLISPKLILGYHVLPDQWLLQGGSVGGGGTLKWFDEQLGAFERYEGVRLKTNSFEIMSSEASGVQPGSGGLLFLPYMAGERSPIWNSNARGVLFGLSYDKSRSHIIRSMMEGVGYSLLHNLNTAEQCGAYVDELVSVGGSSNSEVWTQIKSDITGKVIHVPSSDNSTTLGAAILAGIGTGIYKDFDEAVNMTVHIRRTHTPDMKNHAIYQRYYELYLDLYSKLKDCYETLHEICCN